MAVFDFDSLVEHRGHQIEVNVYGTPDGGLYNVAVECMDCNEILLDYDNEKALVCQCGSCEQIFSEPTDIDTCPYCNSGNWVRGYIDQSEPKFDK